MSLGAQKVKIGIYLKMKHFIQIPNISEVLETIHVYAELFTIQLN